MRTRQLIAAAALAIAVAAPAAAQDSSPGPLGGIVAHAMAMHGTPKYPADFAQFDYADPAAPRGGELRQHVVGSFDSLNPYVAKGTAAAGRQYVFESLMARAWDEPFSLYGLIAESVEMPADRSWVAFTLRAQARWHDGTPITVDDVMFSLQTLRDHGHPRFKLYYSAVAAMEQIGERTLKLTFGEGATRETPMLIGLMPIISKAWFTAHDFEAADLEPPLGSGPYRVAAVDAGNSVTYERVADYWGADLPVNRGHYNFDRIRIEYYRDATVAMEAFLTGEYDIRSESDPARWATAYAGPAVDDGRITLAELPNRRPSGMLALVFNLRRPIFADARVREALAYAVDFPWLNETLFHGGYARTRSLFDNSALASSGVPEGTELALLEPYRAELPAALFTMPFAVPGDGTELRQNLRAARELLAGAGWQVQGDALVDAAGAPLAFEILLVDPALEKVALAFADNLARLGVGASVRTVDSAQYQQRRDAFDFDMVVHNWGVTLSPGSEQRLYWGSEAAAAPGSRNYAGIASPAVDALVEALADAHTGEELAAAAHALDRVLLWGRYFIPLYYAPVDRVAYWDRLARPQVTPLYGFVLETWWANPEAAP